MGASRCQLGIDSGLISNPSSGVTAPVATSTSLVAPARVVNNTVVPSGEMSKPWRRLTGYVGLTGTLGELPSRGTVNRYWPDPENLSPSKTSDEASGR